mmetsp:Transcript_8430/g.15907  ORF Transcript_8430/g.15907 Transcript_8430/m.15907 type:complete len:105 (+) Transcript_8430:1172-1486(+)
MKLKVKYQHWYNTSTAYVAWRMARYKLILEKMRQIQSLARRGMIVRKRLGFARLSKYRLDLLYPEMFLLPDSMSPFGSITLESQFVINEQHGLLEIMRLTRKQA